MRCIKVVPFSIEYQYPLLNKYWSRSNSRSNTSLIYGLGFSGGKQLLRVTRIIFEFLSSNECKRRESKRNPKHHASYRSPQLFLWITLNYFWILWHSFELQIFGICFPLEVFSKIFFNLNEIYVVFFCLQIFIIYHQQKSAIEHWAKANWMDFNSNLLTNGISGYLIEFQILDEWVRACIKQTWMRH